MTEQFQMTRRTILGGAAFAGVLTPIIAASMARAEGGAGAGGGGATGGRAAGRARPGGGAGSRSTPPRPTATTRSR